MGIRYHSFIITQLLILLLLVGCASEQAPSSSGQNEAALRVVSASPEDGSTRLSPDVMITLVFSNPVLPRNLLDAVTIKPQQRHAPDVRAGSGNTMLIKPAEPLTTNSTCIMTIDKSVTDIHGRSMAAPYQLAFSTGSTMDSGVIEGKVVDASFSPIANVRLLAFKKPAAGEAIQGGFIDQPDHVAETDKTGAFRFARLAKGGYRIVAFQDRNNDRQFNPGTEPYALSCRDYAEPGTHPLIFMFKDADNHLACNEQKQASEASGYQATGTISGYCQCSTGQAVIIADNGSRQYCMVISGNGKTQIPFALRSLPAGRYRLSAFKTMKKINTKEHVIPEWDSGNLQPFRPAEPFWYMAEPVTVRGGWVHDHLVIPLDSLCNH